MIYPSNLIAYSTESSTEQMLQLTQSYDIRDKIINTFHLFEHYNIDTLKNKTFKSEVYKKYDENIIIKKNFILIFLIIYSRNFYIFTIHTK